MKKAFADTKALVIDMSFFEVKDIHKKFGDTPVLKGVDLTVEKGETVALIGSSGNGKTTLLRCINFLEFPDKGKMFLDGNLLFDKEKTASLSDKALRRLRLHFGLVFQHFNLFSQYTVFENLCLAPKLLAKEEPQFRQNRKELMANIEERAAGILAQVGMSHKKDAYPGKLSGGQQQRAAIARALVMSPDILCFDEPTSALDPELTGEVLKVLKELATQKITMIIVTHELSFAGEVANKIAFMDDGRIAEWGTPKELFSEPKTDRLKEFLRLVL